MQNNDMLKQFPDIGANHTPRALRKDVWRPFFTLSMPEGAQGMAQGLMAFRQLREWRKMHEVSWDVSPLLARPHTEKEIKALQEKLDDRGGSKAENVWDIIKRAKKKMRVHAVMNQKANSVADLATVLQDLDGSGSNVLRQQIHELKEDREREVKKMLQLAEEYGHGGLGKLQQEITAIERRLEKPASELVDTSKANLRTALYQFKGKQKQMRFAARAVALARRRRGEPLLVQSWRKNTPEETEVLQHRARYLPELAARTFDLSKMASTQRTSKLGSLMEKLRTRGAQARVLRHVAYHQKLCEQVGPLADEILAHFHENRLAHLAIKKSDLWTLEQVMENLWDSAINITGQMVDFARGEVTQERRDKESGWDERVKDLNFHIRRAETDLKRMEEMRDAEIRIPERNRNRPPVKLDPEAEWYPEKPAEELQEGVTLATEDTSASTGLSPAITTEEPERPIRLVNPWHEFLPSFPAREVKNIPKRGPLRSKMNRLARPVFNTSNVQVYWENVLDAEYAESWPETVSHHSMGYARHAAPDPREEPVQGLAELRARADARSAAAVQPKGAKQIYLEGLQNEILQEMTSKVVAEQAAADLISERENRRLIKNVGLHKKSVKRRRAREREAAAQEKGTAEVSFEA
nr:hypothetical protein CFP56_02599 [Quercus suber]